MLRLNVGIDAEHIIHGGVAVFTISILEKARVIHSSFQPDREIIYVAQCDIVISIMKLIVHPTHTII